MALEQNNTELHRKYVVADLGSDITRYFGIVLVELVEKSARVLQIYRKSTRCLSSIWFCIVIQASIRRICLYLWGKNYFYLLFPNLRVDS